MQSSTCAGRIKIDWTQLMQVEMPIFFGDVTEMKLSEKISDVTLVQCCLQAVVYLSVLLDRISPLWCAGSAYHCMYAVLHTVLLFLFLPTLFLYFLFPYFFSFLLFVTSPPLVSFFLVPLVVVVVVPFPIFFVFFCRPPADILTCGAGKFQIFLKKCEDDSVQVSQSQCDSETACTKLGH